jgi:hypothetical protein
MSPTPLTLSPHWPNHSNSSNHHNRTHSLTSLNSAATFHSAFNEMEQTRSIPSPIPPPSPSPISHKQNPSVEAIQMIRSDSGYEDGSQARRSTSTSSSRRPRHSSSVARPAIKRAAKSTQTSSRYSGPRPPLQSRYTNPRPATSTSNLPTTYQFFQFPSLVDTASLPTETESVLRPQGPPHTQSLPPPPSTPLYWTSSETRRLEYAAIDAASKGIRGFVTRLVPDCILPKDLRRTRFSNDDDADDDDAGSVRRYRLRLPEEKGSSCGGLLEMTERHDGDAGIIAGERKRPGFLGRFWRK